MKPVQVVAKASPKGSLRNAPERSLRSGPVSAQKSASKALDTGAQVSMEGLTPTLTKDDGTTQAAMTPKTFRTNPDMENFYRFIYENDLRTEALTIIDEIISLRKLRKKKGEPAKLLQ